MTKAYAAKTPEDLPTLDTVLSMSGLDFMKAVRDGEIAGPPIAGLMNIAMHEVDEGRVAFRGTPEFAHSNPMQVVHGGWYGTLLDSALGCAVMTTVPQGSVYTTLEYKVNITRPIPLGTEVEAVATIQHTGRSTGVANCEIRGVADGRLYATGSTTCIIMKMR
jgi:uncharacterized protein (TIGR00369 family)